MSLPGEIISLIFSFVQLDLSNNDTCFNSVSGLLKFRMFGSKGAQALDGISTLVLKMDDDKRRQRLMKHLMSVPQCFHGLKELYLEGLCELTSDQLYMLCQEWKSLHKLTLYNCLNVTSMEHVDISKFKEIYVDRNVLLRASLIEKITKFTDPTEAPVIHVLGGYPILLKNLQARVEIVHVCHEDSIGDVKELYGALTGIKPDCQRYIFAGKRLCDEYTMSQYNIQKDSTLHVVLRLRGGRCEPEVNTENTTHVNIYQQLTNIKNEQMGYRCILSDENNPGCNVYELQLLEEEICDTLFNDIIQCKKEGHDYYLSDSCLSDCRRYVEKLLIPQINQNNLFEKPVRIVKDCFIVNYATDKDSDLMLHMDHSYLTLNICVHKNQCEGNEIEFLQGGQEQFLAVQNELNHRSHVNSLVHFKQVTPMKGVALLHRGSHPHQTLPILHGERFNIVFWLE